MSNVKSRVEQLEKAQPTRRRDHGRRFCEALQRAYGKPDEPAEAVITDAEFEAAMESYWR